MMENLQERVKLEFPHYKCFPAVTKLIVRLHHMLLNSEEMLWLYWKIKPFRGFLFIAVRCAQYQESVC